MDKPKGMKGYKHSEESKRKIGYWARKMWEDKYERARLNDGHMKRRFKGV